MVNRTFVTWGFVEDHLLKFTSKDKDGNYTSLVKSIIKGDLSEKSVEILNFKELRSCDLDVCILPGQESISPDAEVKLSNGNLYKIIKNSSKNYVSNVHNLNPFSAEFEPFAVTDSPNRGYLRNILINTSFIEGVYDGLGNEPTLNTFILKLLDGINDACGRLWDFSIISLPYNEDKLTIVDNRCLDSDVLKYIDNDANNDYPYLIQNHFLKGFTIATNLSDNISTRAYLTSVGSSYGYSTSEANTYDFYGQNKNEKDKSVTIVDRLRLNRKDNGEDKEGDKPRFKDDEDDKVIVKSGKENPILEYFNRAYIYLNTGHNKSSAKSSLTKLVAELLNGSSSLEYKPLIGLTVSFTIPGMTGIYMGNAFTLLPISQGGWLPDRYYEQVLFQIHEINHTIDSTKWETNVSSLMRHKQSIDTEYFDDTDSALQAYINDESIVEDDFKDPPPPEPEEGSPEKPKLGDGEFYNFKYKQVADGVTVTGGVAATNYKSVRVDPKGEWIDIMKQGPNRGPFGLLPGKTEVVGRAYFDENGNVIKHVYGTAEEVG